MEDLSIFFEALDTSSYKTEEDNNLKQIGDTTVFHEANDFPDLEGIHVAIVGVKEARGANDYICSKFVDHVRDHFYKLFGHNQVFKMADLGNINPGNTIQDTYHALSNVVQELLKHKIIPIIIGGSQDLSFAQYRGYEKLEQTVNLIAIDPRFDLGDVEGELTAESYLGKIVLHQPNYLFNFTNLGYQSYFVDGSVLELMNGLYFDSYRLGEIRQNMASAEPMIRNADIVSFDMAAVRMSDAPAAKGASPHGFYGEEACQMMRYAGMSDKLSSIGFYSGSDKEDGGQTAHLLAQMIWCFMDGYYARKKDFPIGSKENYIKYHVHITDGDHELIFLKSPKSDRWWMEVPYPPDQRLKFERHAMIPCAYSDYEQAMQDELPDLWLRAYKKLS